MKIGSSDSCARVDISFALFLRSEIGLIIGIRYSSFAIAILYHLIERVNLVAHAVKADGYALEPNSILIRVLHYYLHSRLHTGSSRSACDRSRVRPGYRISPRRIFPEPAEINTTPHPGSTQEFYGGVEFIVEVHQGMTPGS
jgi:hypothetical protein